MKKYDFLIVGSGLFGSTCAFKLKEHGKSVLLIEKRNHVGGNIYTKNINGINVHMYGAHIFHTSDLDVWNFVNRFASFNDFINSPIANYRGELYNLPFNMYTFTELWSDVKTVDDAKKRIDSERIICEHPKNLKEQALNLVGTTIFQKLIKEYTEKQWAKKCEELPAFIIQRIPLRFRFDNNYFNDTFQGIPIGGYTKIINKLLEGIEVKINTPFSKEMCKIANKIIYTGPIDEFFDYCYGPLEYRSLRFKHRFLDLDNYQNNAVVNYTSNDVPYTRTIEHKFFENNKCRKTIVTFEYPDDWSIGKERFYTINSDSNNQLYHKYLLLAEKEKDVFFGGRLGMYRYFDMDDTIKEAFSLVERIMNDEN